MKTTRQKTLLVALAVSMLLLAGASTPVWAAGGEKVTICHKPGTPAELTLEVAAAAVDAHLEHGDYLGECSQVPQGCQALNNLVPDIPTDSQKFWYLFPYAYFRTGETVHADLTVLAGPGGTWAFAHVVPDPGAPVASQYKQLSEGETGTVSVDYTIAYDGNYSVGVNGNGGVSGSFWVQDVNFWCTPN